jgi:hypothetical protein
MRIRRSVALLAALGLCALAGLAGPAPAARAATSSYTVPPEWAGVWVDQDSVYQCPALTLTGTSTSTDTLCAGQDVMAGLDTGGFEFTLDCTGTATATTLDVTCTGSAEVMAGCTVTMTIHTQGTRTSDTAVTVTTSQLSYSGSAFGCDLLPASCTRRVSRSTRTGPAPAAYCSTPALPQSWGALKVRYR